MNFPQLVKYDKNTFCVHLHRWSRMMETIRSKEYESKQLVDLITDIYKTLDDEDLLTAPNKEHGIFKYSGSSPQSQSHLSKISKKRGANRSGLGFVLQRAVLPEGYRISADVEISQEVSGIDPQTLYENMETFVTMEYRMTLPSLILYSQPGYSGRRGWDSKTFTGIEVYLDENDLGNLAKTEKKLLDQIRKLFYALDYALTNS